jgi:hypothetical protein
MTHDQDSDLRIACFEKDVIGKLLEVGESESRRVEMMSLGKFSYPFDRRLQFSPEAIMTPSDTLAYLRAIVLMSSLASGWKR